MAIERPVKLFDFGAVQVAPAYEIDRQFDNHKRSIDALIRQLAKIVRADGKLNDDILTPESFPRQTLDKIQSAAFKDATRAQEAAASMLKQIAARQTAIEASAKDLRGLIRKIFADNQATRDVGAEVQARAVALSAAVAPRMMQTQAVSAKMVDDANEILRQAAVAEDWANVSIAWAEHMPDTIPPNILATNAITGDHWSSRWWANKSASAFGMMAWWYQGAWPSPGPPSTPLTPTGDPLPIGAMYFDTDRDQMMIWTGLGWGAVGFPATTLTASLFYQAAGDQTAFVLTDADMFGKSYTLRADGSMGIMAFLNGARLTPDDGTGKGDFIVAAAASTVTLLRPATAGASMAIDVLVPQADIQPGSVLIRKMKPLVFDGLTTVFPLTVTDNSTPTINDASELFVVLDGVPQEPGVDYTASGIMIFFAAAPAADVRSYITWYATASI